MTQWQPGASIDLLRRRAELLATIRSFFSERGVMEVETPLLASSTATDIHIQSLSVPFAHSTPPAIAPLSAPDQTRYLQTSPEFAMKRLLAAGSGSIFQICKAFRQDETTRLHNCEFTMLEWYRPGFSMEQLMDEVELLLMLVMVETHGESLERFSYKQLFQQHLGIDPHTLIGDELKQFALSRIDVSASDLSDTDYLQLLMAECIEPAMPALCFVYDYPAAQAALSRVELDSAGQAVAKRFELYCAGMELANGYFELVDAAEQRARFESDLRARQQLGLPAYPVDEKLLAALESGMPECAGVALGIDRLLMAVSGRRDISEVLSFDAGRV